MDRVDISRDHPPLDELLARAAADGSVEMVRDGAVVATLTIAEPRQAAEQPKRKFDFDELKQFTDSIRKPGPLPESSVVEMRKDYRY